MNTHEARLVHQIASWCLGYPDDALLTRLQSLRHATETLPGGQVREDLLAIIEHLGTTPLRQLQQHYVETFDLNRRHALHLSYWTDGDTRRRGAVLLRFKQRYRSSGFVVDTRGELPDHLPLVLEYAAVVDPVDGSELLQEYRASLELLRLALLEDDPVYGRVVAAICATLPGPSPADRAAVHAMAADGPPREDVGLDAYDPRLLALTPTRSPGGVP